MIQERDSEKNKCIYSKNEYETKTIYMLYNLLFSIIEEMWSNQTQIKRESNIRQTSWLIPEPHETSHLKYSIMLEGSPLNPLTPSFDDSYTFVEVTTFASHVLYLGSTGF